jgi:serine/threonine protein kinase
MLGSRWIIGALLGQSEGAEVYEGEEAHQRRFAAIKFFDPAFGAEPAWSEHVRITRALSELPGDGVARAYDFGVESAFRRPYVASERITFPTLARYVADRGCLSLRAVAQSLETLAGGLDTAHAAGIVHGGLKPQNVFISFENPRWARFTDFGVARLRAQNRQAPPSVLGWGPPEAAEGVLTAAGDRYALGLLCFFAATGMPWYSALRVREEPASDPRRAARLASERAKSQGGELDPVFDAWFERALAADPNERFPTALEMARAFLAAFAGGPTAAQPARPALPFEPLSMPSARGLPVEPAPETPMAATVAVSSAPLTPGARPSAVPSRPSFWSVQDGAPRPSGAPGSAARASLPLAPPVSPLRRLWFAAAALGLVLLALLVGWLRTR